jgi:Tfp pilus assembly protein PilF
VSLINDALKAAQQERGRSLTPTKPQPIGNLFPYPQREVKQRPKALFIGAIVATVVVVGATAVVLKQRSDNAKTAVQHQGPSPINRAVPPVATNVGASTPIVSGTVVNKPAASPQVVSKSAPPAIGPVQRAALSAPAVSVVRAPRQTATANAAPKRDVPTTSAEKVSAPVTDAPTPPVTVQPPSSATTNAPIKLVLDPAGARPADSLSRLAYAEQVKNNLDGARDLYEKAIATKQASAEAFNNYGVLLEQQGNRSLATEMFRQAIARDDKNVEAWVNLGDSFIAAGHHGSALSAFDRARQLDPTRAAVKIRLADEHLAIGDTAGAKRTLEDAVRSSPDDARAHYALGTLLQMLADYRGAIREFDLFIEQAAKSTEFSADKLTEVRRHVASLRRVAP